MSADFVASISPLMDPISRGALRLAKDQAEADDLVQDVMVRAYRAWDRFEPGSDVRAWMFTILRNTFYNRLQSAGRRARAMQSLAEEPTKTAYERGVDEAIDAAGISARVRDAIANLPPIYRVAVTMADIEGMAYAEIAEAMGCPIGTVMSRLHRGRKMLRQQLADHAAEIGLVS